MQAEKQKSWKIYIHARAKNFQFKLKATNIIPTWELHQCSVLLKLGKLFRLNSKFGTVIFPRQQQPKTLKSKFVAFLKNLSFRRSNNRAIGCKRRSDRANPEENRVGWFAYKEPICRGSLVVGILAFLVQSISNKDRKGIFIHGFVISLYVASLFKKRMPGKFSIFFVLLRVAIVLYSLVFELGNYLRYDYLRMACDYLVSPDERYFSSFYPSYVGVIQTVETTQLIATLLEDLLERGSIPLRDVRFAQYFQELTKVGLLVMTKLGWILDRKIKLSVILILLLLIGIHSNRLL